MVLQVFPVLVFIRTLCQCAHGGGRILQVSVQRLIVRKELRIKRVNFLEQQQRLVHLAVALLAVLGLLVIAQNILFHCHETIKCIVMLAWLAADTNGTNCMVPLLVTKIRVLQRI